MPRRPLLLALVPLVAACTAQTPAPPASVSRAETARAVRVPATRVPPPAGTGFRAPRVMTLPGLESVLGATTAKLQSEFGTPRLDVWEGDARKLQFSGEACVLDVYLYPARPGAEPTATYVDARRASDGLDVDRAACVKALKR